MKKHHAIESLLDQAEAERRCMAGMIDWQRRALRRRLTEGVLVAPHRNVYARAAYWDGLNPIERQSHIAKALSQLHPTWVFDGITAACLQDLEHSYELHTTLRAHVVCSYIPGKRQSRRIVRTVDDVVETTVVQGVRVTTVARTLIDCAERYSFAEVLPMFNSALRKGEDLSDLPTLCHKIGGDELAVARLCHYATPLCANGAESKLYGLIIEMGFVRPIPQYPFPNPANPAMPYHVDFAWVCDDGTIIVVEFDGMGKYVLDNGDSSMPRDVIRRNVRNQLDREQHIRRRADVVLRLEYEDLLNRAELYRKLCAAGIPEA